MAKAKNVETQSEPGRRFRPVAIGECAAGIGDRAIRKRGFAEPRIIAEWERIVGPDLARTSRPVKLTERSGALTIKVGDGATAMRLTHMTIQITERVNAYFGYRAISRISVLQGVLPRTRASHRREKLAPKPIPEAVANEIDMVTNAVPDDKLKDALRRLGRAIAADPTKT